MNQLIPIPASNVTVRPATMADLPFMDSLQKLHTKQVGWMPTKQLEGKIGAGHVLVAWATSPCPSEAVNTGWQPVLREEPVGYCIGHDQYFKRDDVGIIYQVNVLPAKRRGLIGATLIKAMFERAAYGCRLFCCWCAQDIEANRFWEALGFVPLAFRTGSRGKERVHIFWQKRIRAGDETTPYWFPFQTNSGSIREDRLVFPIPPGTHWSDAKPIVLPGLAKSDEPKQLPTRKQRKAKVAPVIHPLAISAGGLRFAAPKPAAGAEKPEREKRQRVKNDPKYIAAARELRDRWLEEVNSGRLLPARGGKYEVSRQPTAAAKAITTEKLEPGKLLQAA